MVCKHCGIDHAARRQARLQAAVKAAVQHGAF